MVKNSIPNAAQTQALMDNLFHRDISDNPLSFVLGAFPWGQRGTPLEEYKGPLEWQREELQRIADFVVENRKRQASGLPPEVYKLAIASGRGIGKSALVAWLSLWNLSCHFGSTTIVSANTAQQLTSYTFGEIGKWYVLLPNKFWFERMQTMIRPAPWMAAQMEKKAEEGGYATDIQHNYIDGKLWNEDDPHSFAGAHNKKGMMVIFDEASGIPESIWSVTRGFFSDISIHRYWITLGNPRCSSGPYFDCFHDDRANEWRTRQIDASKVEGIDKSEQQKIIDKYGVDSREARVEVRGEFPEQGDNQFISRGIVADACDRALERSDNDAPLVVGVDVARFGNDHTVILTRRGRDARSFPPIVMKGADNMAVANRIAHHIDQQNPDAVFVDSGAGSGVIDRLKEMGYKIKEVNFGTASTDSRWYDHRTELWAKMRDWINGAMLNRDHRELCDQLCWPEYEVMGREDKVKLESKDKMKKRKLQSPDFADALAVTFHCPVARQDIHASRKKSSRKNRSYAGVGADIEFG